MSKKYSIIIAVVVLAAGAYFLTQRAGEPVTDDRQIIDEGGMVIDGDGVAVPGESAPGDSEVMAKGGCVIGGCSSEICAEEALGSTCEFLEEYSCYKTATCERQTDGACGWTETSELTQCIDAARAVGTTPLPSSGPTSGSEVFVTVADEGFSPELISIQAGTTVIFMNVSTRDVWPASNVHPTHANYPGSGITKCGDDDGESIFDACKAFGFGESWSFRFDEVGAWAYHDHKSSRVRGTIDVVPAS